MKITHVAVKWMGNNKTPGDGTVYSLPAPNRHCHVFQHMIDLGVPTPIGKEQGFLTESGDFVNRKEALKIALESGQTTREKIAYRHRNVNEDSYLISEDLW